MAFVGAFTPASLSRGSAFGGARLAACSKNGVARFSMATGKSPAVPFLDAPDALSPDMPGYVGFDPLSISNYINVKWLQEAEIKHGRVCMLAMLGYLVAEVYQFPWYSNVPHLVNDRYDWGVHNGSLTQVLLWTSFFEIITTPAVIQMITGKSDREPGYFAFDPLGLGKDPAKLAKYKVNEIKNGRLAMLAVSGVIHHAAVTHQNTIEQLSSGNIVPPV